MTLLARGRDNDCLPSLQAMVPCDVCIILAIARPHHTAVTLALPYFWQVYKPDTLIAAGEIACTYASGCCTREQAMLIAYHRGRLPTERGITSGLMAATGLSADQVRERTAGTNVVLACDNSPTSTTVAGECLIVVTSCSRCVVKLKGGGVVGGLKLLRS